MPIVGKFACVPHVKSPVKYTLYSGKFMTLRQEASSVFFNCNSLITASAFIKNFKSCRGFYLRDVSIREWLLLYFLDPQTYCLLEDLI